MSNFHQDINGWNDKLRTNLGQFNRLGVILVRFQTHNI